MEYEVITKSNTVESKAKKYKVKTYVGYTALESLMNDVKRIRGRIIAECVEIEDLNDSSIEVTHYIYLKDSTIRIRFEVETEKFKSDHPLCELIRRS